LTIVLVGVVYPVRIVPRFAYLSLPGYIKPS
jgi:hypothetical protein